RGRIPAGGPGGHRRDPGPWPDSAAGRRGPPVRTGGARAGWGFGAPTRPARNRLRAGLTERDPAAAAAILPSNARRIVRALEVLELTGAPFRAELPEPTPYSQTVHIGVDVDRSELDERIARRVEQMWADGLVDEVRDLAAR